MGKDFLAAFLGLLYRIRTFVFEENVGNNVFEASLQRVKHFSDRDHHAIGLVPELLVNNVKICVDYRNLTALSYAQYAIPDHDGSEWDKEHCLVCLLSRAPADAFNLSLDFILASCRATHFPTH
jgi:hypothetical protein